MLLTRIVFAIILLNYPELEDGIIWCVSLGVNMFLPADHPDFPRSGMVFAPSIVGLWYWCTDQYIIQRTLAAHNETHAFRGTIWGAYLKLTPIFIFNHP
jgi:SSS family solute:Na+ symporter